MGRARSWTPVRKIAAAFLAGLIGWGGWVAYLGGTGELDLEAALKAAALPALAVAGGYLTPAGKTAPAGPQTRPLARSD